MVKLQQFYILKISSARLRDKNYKINSLDLNTARLNGEVVQIAMSQLVRTLFKLKNKNLSQYEIDTLLEERKKLSRKKSSPKTRQEMALLDGKIDELLFIPELINVKFDDRRHYTNIVEKKGFLVNGKRYVPFMSSAGQIRRSSSLFIEESLKHAIQDIFNNGRDLSKEIVPAKFSAYYALYSSSSIPVTFPRLAVIPDLTIKSIRKVDFSTYVDEKTDPLVEERNMELEFNAFDGSGIITPSFARKVARDLELDYVPSTMIIRAPFLKGMVVTFDIQEFAKDIAKKDRFVDIYGNVINVSDVDCVVTESMFKLWDSYPDTATYVRNCDERELDFAVSKVNPKEDKTVCKSSYQFLQVLELEDSDVESITKDTLSWLENVSGGSLESTLLYLLGDVNFQKGWFSRLEPLSQALLLENSLINDDYFRAHFKKSILKKKNDAKIGRLLFEGNYSMMIPDPYLHARHIFGIELKPLLAEGEHFSHFWNERGVSQVAGIRSPIVHSSEVDLLNFKQTDDVRKWFKWIKSGVVFPANGVGMDFAILGGGDSDGDLVATINSPEIIKGRVVGNPIMYEAKKAEKFAIDDEHEQLVIDSQIKQIGTNKIGFYTNVSSTLYALLYSFRKGTPEREMIERRLKYGRTLQGLAIDSAKGLVTDAFPEYWVKWKRHKDGMTPEEEAKRLFNNSILADKRPYFMRWLYSHYNRRYISEMEYYNSVSLLRWDISFRELLDADAVTPAQQKLIDRYRRRSFFIDNASTMNRITKHVERFLKQMSSKKSVGESFDHRVLYSSSYKRTMKTDVEKMALLHREYKALRRTLREKLSDDYSDINAIFAYIRQRAYSTISSNAEDLGNLVVNYAYEGGGKMAKSFIWNVFGREIVENIRSRTNPISVRVPMRNKKGTMTYLWDKFGMYTLNLEG